VDITATITQLRVALWDLSFAYWKTQVLFSARWWGLLAVIACIYAIWWMLTDKRRLSEILLLGSFVAVGRIVMDIIGTNMVLWSYIIREVPFYPSPFLHDFTITPLALMIVHQYSPSWKQFMLWTTVTIGIISFVFFPVLGYLGYLKLVNWNYFYSFILIIFIAVLSRAVLLWVLRMERRQRENADWSATFTFQAVMKPFHEEDNDEH
jgi:hypothetical protein